MQLNGRILTILTILLVSFCGTVSAQITRERITRNTCSAAPVLNGVYRIDVDRSDKLYSVIEGATSKVPYSEQQQFFIDLAIRLTPPDLLAIECRGSRVSLASSRSPRVEFLADGVTRDRRNAEGRVVHSRIAFERESLTFASTGGSDDALRFTFTPLERGRSLRVTRRISARELIEPVVIQTVYNKIDDTAHWDIFDNSQVAKQNSGEVPPAAAAVGNVSARPKGDKASALRESLNQWIEATNARDIERQMSFYMPELKAFYLARNAPRSLVRAEKNQAFAAAKSIDIRVEEPEIVFQDGERTAIMRFRKKYSIESGAKRRSGEVIQELRWQQTVGGWKIFSERDVRVIS